LSQISIQIDTSALKAALEQTLQELTMDINNDIQEAGKQCQKKAVELCPVSDRKEDEEHQHMRDTIEYEESDLSCRVGTDTYYAPFVEMGHHTRSGSFVPAQPFLYPAFQEAVQQLQSTLIEKYA
jgi:HK97 gp10 family phage protein